MIKLETYSEQVGPRRDKSWRYKITLGTRSPIRLTNVWPKGYATEQAAKKAGRRAIDRFKREL